MADQCLHLLCPLAVEERVLDALLALGRAGVFASTPAHAHGFSHGLLSPEEQVSGRSGALLVQVLLAEAELGPVLAELQREFAGSGLRYWTTPVARQGEFQ